MIPYSFQLFTTPNNLYNCTTELLQYNYIILHRCQCCAFCFHAELQFCSILSHFFRGRREWKKLLCSQRATIPVMHLLKWGSMGAFGKGCFLRLLSVSCKPFWNAGIKLNMKRICGLQLRKYNIVVCVILSYFITLLCAQEYRQKNLLWADVHVGNG